MTIYIKIPDVVPWEKERDVDDDGINCLQKFEVGRKELEDKTRMRDIE